MSLASPFWQGILFFFAGLILLWQTWRGWKRGIIRSMIHFAAWVLSGFVGFYAGKITTIIVGKFLPTPAVFIGMLVGIAATLIILVLLLLPGAILFKRTDQQSSGMLRLLYGMGGAFFGILTGLFLLWGGITLIRASGAVAEYAIANSQISDAPAPARMLITLKESLELEPAGKVITSIDIVPPQIYDLIVRFGKLKSNEDAMRRFFDYPGVQEILENPSMDALLRDPSVVEAAEKGDIFFLMQNKTVLNAVNDLQLKKLILHFDMKKALDYACPATENLPTHKKQP